MNELRDSKKSNGFTPHIRLDSVRGWEVWVSHRFGVGYTIDEAAYVFAEKLNARFRVNH
tara:strand:- start:147 stop:323 length:177 start_codon:yes stop_codon:yes gene_type:complete